MKYLIILLISTSSFAGSTFSEYLKEESVKKPKVKYVVKSNRCFEVKEHQRIFNLGTYKIYKSIKCKMKNKI